jgi:hypothetical protein
MLSNNQIELGDDGLKHRDVEEHDTDHRLYALQGLSRLSLFWWACSSHWVTIVLVINIPVNVPQAVAFTIIIV